MADILHKTAPTALTKAGGGGTHTFVLSDEAPDLVNDVIVQAGMKPVSDRLPAQIDHAGAMEAMIGVWRNIRTKGKQTLGDLDLVPPGISRSADLVRALLDQGVRLAASVGILPLETEPREPRGYKILKSWLTEVSVVVVPAHPQALAVMKSLGVDPGMFGAVSGNAEVKRLIERARSVAMQKP